MRTAAVVVADLDGAVAVDAVADRVDVADCVVVAAAGSIEDGCPQPAQARS